MAYIVTVTNQKGGVGKTTTAAALASGASKLLGRKSLAIDLDPQCNLSFSFGAEVGDGTLSAKDALDGSVAVADCIQRVEQGDIVPSTLALAGADRQYTDMGASYRLREAIADARDGYDLIVVDTPPTLGILTLMALTASDGVVVPLCADAYSIQAVGQLLETIQTVRKYSNPELDVLGYLVTRFDGRSNASHEYRNLIGQVSEQSGIPLFSTTIREGVAVREAAGSGRSLFDAKSRQSDDYGSFISEFAAKVWGE